MPQKFKIGDLARVKKLVFSKEEIISLEEKEWAKKYRLNQIGRVVNYEKDYPECPYVLEFKISRGMLSHHHFCIFSARELDKVSNTEDYIKEELLEKINQLWTRQEYYKNHVQV